MTQPTWIDDILATFVLPLALAIPFLAIGLCAYAIPVAARRWWRKRRRKG